MEVLNVNRIKYNGDFEITFVSSWFVYGKTECPASEDSVCNPTGFYSITKYAAEKLLASYCDTYGIPYKIVRLANVLGAGDTKVSARKNALQYMIKTLCEGGSINLYEEDCYRDYIHVTDAAEAIRVVARDGVSSETYNAGSGTRSSIHTIIRTVHEMTGNRGIINLIPTPNFHKQVQVRDMWMDTHKIDWELGWSPKVGLSDIIKGLVSEYK
jgi:nucleoside-diphosphate-sugar epimerase